jgi:hypothetical protein
VLNGKCSNDAVDSLSCVERVQSAEDEVPGLSGQHGNFYGFKALFNENDVGVFAKSRSQRTLERQRVLPDFALVYYALAVSVQKLNGVFNGDKMTVSERVDVIDHGCQSCSLS